MESKMKQTERTRVKRLPKRGNYDRETIYAILDEALVCHVGFIADGKPFVIPTLHARIGDELVIHGSAASRMLRNLKEGVEVCVTATLLDGLVLARSAFHHSVNFRSVVIFGTARLVDDPDEKMRALEAFTNHVIRDRWNDVRAPNEIEMKQTMVLSLPLEEASAKIRAEGPHDDDEDYELDVWAGVLPLSLTPSAPEPDEVLRDGIDVPSYVLNYKR